MSYNYSKTLYTARISLVQHFWNTIILGIKFKFKLNKCFGQIFAFISSAKEIYNFLLK